MKPEHHTEPHSNMTCERCLEAAREGALRVHVLMVSKALRAAQHAGRVRAITAWAEASRQLRLSQISTAVRS